MWIEREMRRGFWLFVLALLASQTLVAHARMGGGSSAGGGDLCEDRIKIIRDDLKSWIHNGGSAGLRLPNEISVQQYSDQMLDFIGTAKIRCVSQNDSGYPVAINGTPKVCRFDQQDGESLISCDLTKFNSLNESDQYVLVHHEFAGLGGIEPPNGDDSIYNVSNQISAFLVNRVVKKLSVKPSWNTAPPSPAEEKKCEKFAVDVAKATLAHELAVSAKTLILEGQLKNDGSNQFEMTLRTQRTKQSDTNWFVYQVQLDQFCSNPFIRQIAAD